MLRRIFTETIATTGADMAAALPSFRSTHRLLVRGPVLGLALLASACSGSGGVSGALSSVGDQISSGFGIITAPFMGPTTVIAADSLTAQRVRGGNPAVEALTPEPGNVWPEGEAPRPTLMSGPDEAMRNIPSYSPSLIQGAPAAASPIATPGVPSGRRGSSSAPQPPLASGDFARAPAMQAAPGALSPPPPRPEGGVITTPGGGTAIITGRAGRVSGTVSPQGGGSVTRDGNVETWIGPDGRVSTRVVPN